MKILQLVQQPQRRGAEMFAFDLTTELLERGHQVRTVYLYPGDDDLPHRDGDIRLDGNPTSLMERLPGIHPRLLARLRSVVESFEPEIVQANGARTLKYGGSLKRVPRTTPFGLVYRSIGDPTVWLRGPAKRLVYRHAFMPGVDGIAAVSQQTLDGLESIYSLDGKVVEQIPRGIDPRRLAPAVHERVIRDRLGAGPSTPVVIFVGALTPEKRPDRLARVIGAIAEKVPHVQLWVVGDGPRRTALEADLTDLGLRECARILGTTADVGSYMNAADLLVLTSDTEGLPGVVLEAACLGLPIASTDVGGIRDAVVPGKTGMLADREDEQGMANGCIELLSDRPGTLLIADAARAAFEDRFAIGTVADRYLDLYDRVAATVRS